MKKVCVIGAGPSGITVLKNLLDQGLEAVCYDFNSQVGGNWVYNEKTGTCKKAILLSAVPPSGALMASLRVISHNLGTIPYLFTGNLLGVFRKYPHLMFNDAKIAEKYAPKMCAESFLAFVTLVLPIFHKITTPLLVMGGSNDQLITENEFVQTAKRYGAKLEIVEGGSHDLMLEEEFVRSAEVIKEWLSIPHFK